MMEMLLKQFNTDGKSDKVRFFFIIKNTSINKKNTSLIKRKEGDIFGSDC